MLPDTYSWAKGVDVGGLTEAIRQTANLPLVAVGSGGSLTVAEFASSLHRDICGSPASAQTPLEAVASGLHYGRTAVLMTTAAGSNPDVLGSFERLVDREPKRQVVLCLSSGSPLARLAARFPIVDLFEFDTPAGRDGFLATNSLLASVVLLARAYTRARNATIDLPRTWHQIMTSASAVKLDRSLQSLWERETLLVLHGPSTRAAAIDLESKLTEAAIRNVWTADFRHFAHGRHHWLAKRGNASAVLAFVTTEDRALATKTLALIPTSIPIVRLDLPFDGIGAVVASLARVFYITGSAGRVVGIDPGRPGVPEFGRRIYHLNAFSRGPQRGTLEESLERTAIERKSRTTISALASNGSLDLWRRGFREFVSSIRSASFRGVVLDYDGTLCGQEHRFTSLRGDISKELIRILRSGLIVGVATGRGKSVKERLREALPEALWDHVVMGYYNGGDIGLLSDDRLPDGREEIGDTLRPIAEVLERHPLLNKLATFEFRLHQVKVEAKNSVDSEWIWGILEQVVHFTGVPGVSLLRSSHSVDVLAPGVDKRSVVHHVMRLIGERTGAVLCIGDSGMYPGNDFSLLGLPHALSVDEVSRDPATCWNLAPSGVRSTDACLAYLRRLKGGRGIARFS